MQHHTRHTTIDQSGRWLWHPRTCGRRTVTLRVDYATADGRGWLGLIRNLSLQGMYIDTVSCQVTPFERWFVPCVVHRHCSLPEVVHR